MVRIRERPKPEPPAQEPVPRLSPRRKQLLLDIRNNPGKSGRFWVALNYSLKNINFAIEQDWITATPSTVWSIRYTDTANCMLRITEAGEEMLGKTNLNKLGNVMGQRGKPAHKKRT